MTVCLSGVNGVDLTTIHAWQLLKQQEGQVMTQQTIPARLMHYISSAGVNEFSARAFVSSSAYVDRCLPAAQIASMLLPSSTCCSLVSLPLLWLSAASITLPRAKSSQPFCVYKMSLLSLPLVGQSFSAQ